jgi:hypothetical protein
MEKGKIIFHVSILKYENFVYHAKSQDEWLNIHKTKNK